MQASDLKSSTKLKRLPLTHNYQTSLKLKVKDSDPTDNLISRLREKITQKEMHENQEKKATKEREDAIEKLLENRERE